MNHRQQTTDNKPRTTDKIWIALIVMGTLFFADPTIRSFSTETNSPVLSLEVRNEALADVLEEISEKTGYQILLRGEGEDLPVSIKLKNVTLEEILRRILGKSNYTVIWNEAEKSVLLSIYESSGSLGQKTSGSRPERERERISPPRDIRDRKTGLSNFERKRPRDDDDAPDFSITGRGSRFVQATDTTY